MTHLRRLNAVAGWAVGVLTFALTFMAYFVTSLPRGGEVFDGLGRQLFATPTWVQAVLGRERMWAGWGWAVVDIVAFAAGMAAAGGLITLGQRDQQVSGSAPGDEQPA